jgi:hypothetical protein
MGNAGYKATLSRPWGANPKGEQVVTAKTGGEYGGGRGNSRKSQWRDDFELERALNSEYFKLDTRRNKYVVFGGMIRYNFVIHEDELSFIIELGYDTRRGVFLGFGIDFFGDLPLWS